MYHLLPGLDLIPPDDLAFALSIVVAVSLATLFDTTTGSPADRTGSSTDRTGAAQSQTGHGGHPAHSNSAGSQ